MGEGSGDCEAGSPEAVVDSTGAVEGDEQAATRVALRMPTAAEARVRRMRVTVGHRSSPPHTVFGYLTGNVRASRRVDTLVDVKWVVAPLLGAAVVLTGCGLGSGASVESADDGAVAAAGVSGIEAAFTNVATDSTSFIRVSPSGAQDMEKGMAPGETASLRLEASGTQPVPYVIVGPTAESTSSFEIGFANPAAGSCPNATVDGWKVPLCKVGDTAKWTHRADGAGSAVIDVRRLDNADGRTRYDVKVNWT